MNAAPGPVLRDIHLPPLPGWWPPAPGWWLLCALLLAGATLAWWKWRPRRQARRRARRVLAEFEQNIAALRDAAQAAMLASALSSFARRLVRECAPHAVALRGEAWLAQLDRIGATDEFSRGVGRALIDAPYRPNAQFDAAALVALMRRWTRRVVHGEATRV